MTGFKIGVIEGFYGRPWSWAARHDHIEFLKKEGCSFYIYAPKSDSLLRKGWREPMAVPELGSLARHCREAGLEFGVGLSPYEAYLSFDDEVKRRLLSRFEFFDRIGVDRLAILFDDMKGDVPGLARVQADMLHWIKDRSKAATLMMCPTYYSLDPVLDRIFGARPADYLEELGKALDACIDVFWTGEAVCSKSYSPEHIMSVGELLRRKPFLWDNYPVNDGPRMCKFLHLRAFEGRPAGLAAFLSGHAVNPMNQPELSKIPILTLLDNYRGGRAAPDPASGVALEEDIPLFQDQGLDAISQEQKTRLIGKYASIDHPAAREVVEWLEGRYLVTDFS